MIGTHRFESSHFEYFYEFDDESVKINTIKDNKTEPVYLTYKYYDAYQEDEGQRSGAYIFRTAQPHSETKSYAFWHWGTEFRGNYVGILWLHSKNVDMLSTGWIGSEFMEITTRLSGIELSEQGKEVVIQLQIRSIQNNQTFYTDSMGMEMQERWLNFRPTWDLEVNEPIAGNFYPVNHAMMIKNCSNGNVF